MPSKEAVLRLAIAALMRLTGDHQADLADGIGPSQTQISRKQAARQAGSVGAVDDGQPQGAAGARRGQVVLNRPEAGLVTTAARPF
ncbi:hypothetical protein ABZ401_32500 [Streptomyces sp. NPDC005892]|uniref:hypothetical protein n=1 Tax=Streptomyces sp. NPDC005892 TaxID=3155593 RepID=UPI0033FA6E0F